MPNKPLRPCSGPGCPNLTRGRYCAEHITETTRTDRRENASRRGYTYRWQRESKQFLAGNPWCAECLRQGRHTPATLVDHIRPHKGDMVLFWDRSNWQGLCTHCHNVKTAKEDGGFGNPAVKRY